LHASNKSNSCGPMSEEPLFHIDEECREQNDINVFARDAMPGEWRNYANELRDSAELLWKDRGNELRTEYQEYVKVEDGKPVVRTETKEVYSISRTYVLLAGFALENLLKGCLVASDPSLVNDGKLDDELKTHELASLVQKIEDLSLEEAEKEFCEIAESAIPYWRRYPVPLAHNDVMPEVGMDDELRHGFLSLFSRLDEKLYMDVRDGWQSGIGVKSRMKYDARYDSEERKRKVFGTDKNSE